MPELYQWGSSHVIFLRWVLCCSIKFTIDNFENQQRLITFSFAPNENQACLHTTSTFEAGFTTISSISYLINTGHCSVTFTNTFWGSIVYNWWTFTNMTCFSYDMRPTLTSLGTNSPPIAGVATVLVLYQWGFLSPPPLAILLPDTRILETTSNLPAYS